MDKENRADRKWMIEYWAAYIRTHPDKDWSRKQAALIDAVLQ